MTSPEYHSRLFTARLCSDTSVMSSRQTSLRTCGLTEAGIDCQSVKISVLCEPCSWLCTPRGQPASSCGMCGFMRRYSNPEESFHQSRGPIVCQPSCGWRGNAVCSASCEGRRVLQLRALALMPDSCYVGEAGPAESFIEWTSSAVFLNGFL